MMGAHVLELSRLHEVRKLVTLGTICEYPKFTPVPFHEDDLWNGYPEETNAPYGIAKKSVLVGAQSYRAAVRHERDLPAAGRTSTGRATTSTPRRRTSSRTLIRKMHESRERIVLWGDGSPTREFLYVDDCAEGLQLAAERYDGAEPVNLGTGVEIAIRELAELIAELTGFEGEIEWDTAMPNGQPRRCLDTTRAKELFGFEAHTAVPRRARPHDRVVPRARDRACSALEAAGDWLAALPVVPAPRRHSCAVQLAQAAWFAFETPHNGAIWYSGGDATEYWTEQWSLAHHFIPQPVVGFGPARSTTRGCRSSPERRC